MYLNDLLSPYETWCLRDQAVSLLFLNLSYYPDCLDLALGLVIAGLPAPGCLQGPIPKGNPESCICAAEPPGGGAAVSSTARHRAVST